MEKVVSSIQAAVELVIKTHEKDGVIPVSALREAFVLPPPGAKEESSPVEKKKPKKDEAAEKEPKEAKKKAPAKKVASDIPEGKICECVLYEGKANQKNCTNPAKKQVGKKYYCPTHARNILKKEAEKQETEKKQAEKKAKKKEGDEEEVDEKKEELRLHTNEAGYLVWMAKNLVATKDFKEVAPDSDQPTEPRIAFVAHYKPNPEDENDGDLAELSEADIKFIKSEALPIAAKGERDAFIEKAKNKNKKA